MSKNRYQEEKEKYIKIRKDFKKRGITISTITLACKLCVPINLKLFATYVPLHKRRVAGVKYGVDTNKKTNRTLFVWKKKNKINFENQSTILMVPITNKKKYPINIKIFKNGSLQMTGCRDMVDFYDVTSTLINVLKKGRKIRSSDGTIKKIHFVSKENANKMIISDIKIGMINSNFKKKDYEIDRDKMSRIFTKYHNIDTTDTEIGYVEYKYYPGTGHACVNIKHQYNKCQTSIFVFRTGSIIITGVKSLEQIISAAEYINKILDRYRSKIKIIKVEYEEVSQLIAEYKRLHKPKK